jgi:hypothetical protein
VLALGVVLILIGIVYYLAVPASGTIVIQVRDAPTDFSHVVVAFSGVQVHRADGGSESGWLNLSLASSAIDLMNLRDVTKPLALGQVPAGKYDQVRIVVASASGTMSDGASVAMAVLDGVLKADTFIELGPGGVTTVTLDFDLAHSIRLTGGSWTFMPVVAPVVVS